MSIINPDNVNIATNYVSAMLDPYKLNSPEYGLFRLFRWIELDKAGTGRMIGEEHPVFEKLFSDSDVYSVGRLYAVHFLLDRTGPANYGRIASPLIFNSPSFPQVGGIDGKPFKFRPLVLDEINVFYNGLDSALKKKRRT